MDDWEDGLSDSEWKRPQNLRGVLLLGLQARRFAAHLTAVRLLGAAVSSKTMEQVHRGVQFFIS